VKPEDLVAEFRSSLPFALDDFQLEAIRALANRHSVLVAAPTGTGKTVVGEFGIFMARHSGTRAIYTTPIKALSNQKFREFRLRWGDNEVGLLTGDVVVNREAPVLVMTTEVLRNALITGRSFAAPAGEQLGLEQPREVLRNALITGRSFGHWGGETLPDAGAIVFDEVHYMGDPERGTAWEEAILLAPRGVPLVCLSATVPNAHEIAEWIREAHGELSCVFHDERAVPLEHRYWLPHMDPTRGFSIITVLDANNGVTPGASRLRNIGGELAGRVRWGGATSQGFRGEDDSSAGFSDREPRQAPEPWRVIRYLEGEELTPAIYFLFSRRATEDAAWSCAALRPVPHAVDLVREAKGRLTDLPPEDRNLRQVAMLLGRFLPRGVAVHHAGLLPQVKLLVEELFQAGKLRAVFATDTLALGINMPARTVVGGEMIKFDGQSRRLLTPNEYRQMTGRAGRRGLDERGISILLYSPWVSFAQTLRVISGELLPLESAFRPTYSTAMNLWLRPEDQERLADLYARSLRRFQHDRSLKELTERKQALEDAYERDRATGDLARPDIWDRANELSRVDYDLRRARRAATVEARRTVDGLAQVLERYGYLRDSRPTDKAPYLRALFDTNALTLGELLTNRQLEGLEPAELADALSWFAMDREAPMRGLALTPRLHRLREILDILHGGVLREEERHGLQISRPLPVDFHGLALAWADGQDLASIAQRARVQEGDLVGALQKTLDLVGQLRGAAQRGPLGARLVGALDAADRLLRRGVVEAGYRWAVGGLPEPDEDAAARSAWEVPVLVDEEPFEERRPRAGGRRRGGRPAPKSFLHPRLRQAPTGNARGPSRPPNRQARRRRSGRG
jgi:ATP-dependent RNA helicase HelY